MIMFTKRFIKLPIKTYDKAHHDLTGEQLLIDTFEMINPFQIQSYRQAVDEGTDCVQVTFKDGSTMLIYLKLNEFEKQLNDHTSIANNMP